MRTTMKNVLSAIVTAVAPRATRNSRTRKFILRSARPIDRGMRNKWTECEVVAAGPSTRRLKIARAEENRKRTSQRKLVDRKTQKIGEALKNEMNLSIDRLLGMTLLWGSWEGKLVILP